jgi:hypothetical protein
MVAKGIMPSISCAGSLANFRRADRSDHIQGGDVPTPEDLLRELNEAKATLYALLAAHDAEGVAVRPASGEWSVVENVRHLLYAEEKHLQKLIPDFKWSRIGLPTAGLVRRAGAGTESTDDLAEVLAAWDAVHGKVRLDVLPAEETARALDRNLRHLRSHARAVRTLLGDASRRPA